MSRRKRRNRRKTSPTTPSQSAGEASAPSPSQSKPAASAETPEKPGEPRRLLRIAVAIAVCWSTILVALVVFTGNSMTLNRRQIRLADFIITAIFDDLESKEANVEKEWKHDARIEKIKFASLDSAQIEAGILYVLPVTKRSDATYEITRERLELKANVRVGAEFPFDGIIIQGTTTVRESHANGQSVVVEKGVNDRVRRGSVNVKNRVEVVALGPCYVYRADPQAIRQLERILRELRK